LEKTGRVQDFIKVADLYGIWTFWTYAKRAEEAFADFGSGIGKQLRNHRTTVRQRLDMAIPKALGLVNSADWKAKRKRQ